MTQKTRRIPLTTPDITGPFYMGGAPLRNRLSEPSHTGVPFMLSGTIFGPDGEPIPGAIMDLWQANNEGDYDFTSSFMMRGKVQADEKGQYQIPTVLPGHYCDDGRWRVKHIHFTASAKDYVELTSQIYFENDQNKDNDPWASATDAQNRTLKIRTLSNGDLAANFDLVLDSMADFQSHRVGEELGMIESVSPNPFNDAVLVRFAVFEGGELDIRTYNSADEQVHIVAQGGCKPGRYLVHWEGKNLEKVPQENGHYYFRIRLDGRHLADVPVQIIGR